MAEGTNMDAIIDGWKKFRPDEFKPDAETKKFEELDGIFRKLAENDEKRLKVEKDGVVIEKFNDLDKPLLYIEYRRYSNVYSKMMYNKFFVPIWRAAMDGRTGYVAYPKLTPLKDVLDDFAKKMKQNKTEQEKNEQELQLKKNELNNVDQAMTKFRNELAEELEQLQNNGLRLREEFDKLEEELKNILRLSLPPIALAIDALHKDQPNKRTMCYHRDVCMDNIYLYKEKDKEGKLVYDDARLMLTKLTRGSHEDYVDDKTSSESLYKKYHHHSSLKVKGRLYHRRHDWNSFGVYILEVLDMFYGDDQTEFRCRTSYDSYATDLKKKIEEKLKKKKTDLLLYCQQYLNIAIKCLGLKENKERVVKHTMPSDMIERFNNRTVSPFQLFFEYPISEWTAELLWLYEDARPRGYETYNKMNDRCHSCGEEYDNEKKECSSSKCKKPCRRENGKCQACYLRDKVSIPTKMHCRDVNFKCGEPDSVDDGRNKCKFHILTAASKKCHFYCLPCYTSGERLFCTERHGTTSPILGHHSSYALVLYGEFDEKGTTPNPFKHDADRLKNALRHKLIYGMSEDNIMVEALYDERKSPKECLQEHCEKMRSKIHGENSTTCNNDAAYTLFLFYSGHGGSKKKNDTKSNSDDEGGDWFPLQTRKEDDEFLVIERKTIDDHYKSIDKCSNPTNTKCKAICVEAISITDCCLAPKYIERVPIAEAMERSVQICTEPKEKANGSSGTSDITHWFCQLLRSLYYERCCTPSCKNECRQHIIKDGKLHSSHECQVNVRKRFVCNHLTTHIDEQFNAFIDGECLKQNVPHMDSACGYSTAIRVRISPGLFEKVILAYFNPQGVYLKAFPFKEVDDTSRSTASSETNQGNVDMKMSVLDIDFDCEMKCEDVRKDIEEKLKQSEKYKDKDLQICLLTTLTKSDDYSKYELVCDDNINDRIGSYVLYYHVITEPVQVTLSGKRKDDDSLTELHLELHLDKSDLNDNKMVYRSNVEQKKPPQLPNFFVFIAYALCYRSSANSGQAQDDADTDAGKSFIRKLVGDDRWEDWEDWDSIESSAKEYWNSGDVERFTVERLPDDTISVRWMMDE